jgi:hypothetical protein
MSDQLTPDVWRGAMLELAAVLEGVDDRWRVQCRAENDQRFQSAIEGGLSQAQAAVISFGGVLKATMLHFPEMDLETAIVVTQAMLVEVLK